METITLISNNLYIYIFIMIFAGFLLSREGIKFNKEMLLDYLIFLTNRIILFFIFISFIFVTILTIIGETTLVINFLKELSNMILYYGLFNYAIFYAIKFIIWCVGFFKENELLSFALLKGGNSK